MEQTIHTSCYDLVTAIQDWLIAERPERDIYTFSLDQQGQQIMNMQQQQISRSFLLARGS